MVLFYFDFLILVFLCVKGNLHFVNSYIPAVELMQSYGYLGMDHTNFVGGYTISQDYTLFDYTEVAFDNVYAGPVNVPNYAVMYMNSLDYPYDTYRMLRQSGTCPERSN